jgi:hypothetical protein
MYKSRRSLRSFVGARQRTGKLLHREPSEQIGTDAVESEISGCGSSAVTPSFDLRQAPGDWTEVLIHQQQRPWMKQGF